ncbi:MAG: hypothetical protein ACREFM_20000, partial [Hypericibacter sp.]
MKRAADDSRQHRLFDEGRSAPAAGSLQFDREWRAALSEAIAKSELKREAIAARMEELLGSDPEYPVSKALLDAWTAPNSKAAWRFPLTYLPAFIEATGARWLLDRIAFKCGCSIMDEGARDDVTLGTVKRDPFRLKKLERA